MKDVLEIRDIIKIAREVAMRIKIEIPTDKEIEKQLKQYIKMPILLENEFYQMWIDLYYIAYSALDENEIHYVYITKNHIMEEYEALNEAIEDRGKDIKMPFNLDNTFKEAMDLINMNWSNYKIKF